MNLHELFTHLCHSTTLATFYELVNLQSDLNLHYRVNSHQIYKFVNLHIYTESCKLHIYQLCSQECARCPRTQRYVFVYAATTWQKYSMPDVSCIPNELGCKRQQRVHNTVTASPPQVNYN